MAKNPKNEVVRVWGGLDSHFVRGFVFFQTHPTSSTWPVQDLGIYHAVERNRRVSTSFGIHAPMVEDSGSMAIRHFVYREGDRVHVFTQCIRAERSLKHKIQIRWEKKTPREKRLGNDRYHSYFDFWWS
jgi:hypothetical protein